MNKINIKFTIILLMMLAIILVAGCAGPKQNVPETSKQQTPTDIQVEKAPDLKATEKGTENDKMTDQDA